MLAMAHWRIGAWHARATPLAFDHVESIRILVLGVRLCLLLHLQEFCFPRINCAWLPWSAPWQSRNEGGASASHDILFLASEVLLMVTSENLGLTLIWDV